MQCDMYNSHLEKLTYDVVCLDRTMTIIWTSNDYYEREVFNILDAAYNRWNDVESNPELQCVCCEEYIIECLPEDFKEDIQIIIYDEEDEK